jgi:hypothetical protein
MTGNARQSSTSPLTFRAACLRIAAVMLGALVSIFLTTMLVHAQQIDIAAARQRPAVQAAVKTCMPDRDRLCAFIFPGGGRIVRCLAAHIEQLSPDCRSAMQHARDELGAAGLVPSATMTAPHKSQQ